ncbi:hypothetical protein [Paenibacillus bouchesdurhonensis]|uniref:hypothetical protein n=1 Tax=Paenibacillus bouchesdurhonensis TaxID=1870990 RepID=UPI000DA6060C|nr:hypothetical protein [Paenibacillus bouchesdurhonensis]
MNRSSRESVRTAFGDIVDRDETALQQATMCESGKSFLMSNHHVGGILVKIDNIVDYSLKSIARRIKKAPSKKIAEFASKNVLRSTYM